MDQAVAQALTLCGKLEGATRAQLVGKQPLSPAVEKMTA